VGDLGKPERIVEDEPISFPDAEPLAVPVPAEPIQTPAEAPAGEGTGRAGTVIRGPAPDQHSEGPEPPRPR